MENNTLQPTLATVMTSVAHAARIAVLSCHCGGCVRWQLHSGRCPKPFARTADAERSSDGRAGAPSMDSCL
jgi:hypothetical protein